ncbi:hypothetical protein JCM9279_003373 [Rhodotorula babjevae]
MAPVALDSPSSSSSATGGSRTPKVLLADPIHLATPLFKQLSAPWDVVTLSSSSRAEFLADCRAGRYDGVEAMYRHFKGASTKVTGLLDPELVEALPKSLQFIAHNGAGYDQINVQACTDRRIQVSNVPVAVDGATADTALFLMLGALRQFNVAQANLRAGKFNAGLEMSHDPEGKVLGIVGMGGIGRAFAKRARALGMTVVYHNRNRLSPALEDGATYVSSLDELLSTADVVSLNLPLNAHTRHTMSSAQFARMKPTSVLINTARGGVVDEEALVEALEAGEIAACGLDVYEEEPKIHEGLLRLEGTKAFLLPHVGTLTVETQREMESVCLRQIKAGLETGKLPFTVPEQKGRF